MKKYYVYAYLREDKASPYYIGKGSGQRAWYRVTSGDRRPPADKSRIVIVRDDLTEDDALALEKILIKMWGRRCDGGVLRNLQEGGSQPPSSKGKKRSEETRRRMSEANRRRWADPEYKARTAAKMKEAWKSRDKTHITGLRHRTLAGG